MNYLFTAAGLGSRFLKEGVKPPKPLINVFGRELLLWSISSFNFSPTDTIYFVTLKEHGVREKLYRKISILYPQIDIHWLELDDVTQGQLDTAVYAIKYFELSGSLVVHNCDTYFSPFSTEFLKTLTSDGIFGSIPYFYGEGTHWSFVQTDAHNASSVLRVAEKNRISDKCSVGTYIFSDVASLLVLYESFADFCIVNGERYIAPIFQVALDNHYSIKACKVSDVRLYGTPSELLKSFDISFLNLLSENDSRGHQRQTLVVDIDGTICASEPGSSYMDATPQLEICDALRRANDKGYYIILFTARNMRSFRGSLGMINKYTAPVLLEWLKKHDIPYDEIYYGKPWGYNISYVDDKSLDLCEFAKC